MVEGCSHRVLRVPPATSGTIARLQQVNMLNRGRTRPDDTRAMRRLGGRDKVQPLSKKLFGEGKIGERDASEGIFC